MIAGRVEAAMTTETITTGSITTDTDAPSTGTGRLMTLDEVAHLFHVDPRTVTRWAKTGHLHPIRTIGYGHRYLEDEVHALLHTTT